MKSSRRTAPSFPFALSTRLGACSTGVITGALSLVSSDAAIVYVNNSAAAPIVDTNTTDASYTTLAFDLNSDGAMDLRFWTQDRTGTATNYDNNALLTAPLGAGLTLGAVGIAANGYLYPARLAGGASIDGSAGFVTLPQVSTGGTVGWLADGNANGPGYTNSQFTVVPTNTGYIGLKFKIAGNDHFGWIRITVAPQSTVAGSHPRAITVHEWAYEDVQGQGLEAGAGVIPEPTSLGLLALGSLGLAAHRRRKVATA